MGAAAEVAQGLVHLLLGFLRCLGPPLRPEYIHILTKCRLVPMDSPWTAANDDPARNLVTAHDDSRSWGDAFHDEAGWGMDAEAFFNACVEVGHRCRRSGVRRELRVCQGGVDLFLKRTERCRMLQ